MSNKEEGIPRYKLEVRYLGKTFEPLFLFHQKRTFGEESELLTNTHLIPRRVQDVIASSADITVVGSIAAMSAIVDWDVRSRAKIATQELKGLEDCLDEFSSKKTLIKKLLETQETE